MAEPLIETRALRKVYRQGKLEVEALRSIDLVIERGEFTVLAGPSGSGKSTLLNLVGALDAPSGGVLKVAGRDLGALTARERAHFRRDQIGFVFQAYNLLPVLSALENAELVLQLQGRPANECRERAERLLRAVGLGDLMRRLPAELSGGQQQRVAVARAMAPVPSLVLADEPTANLDSRTGEALLDQMVELNRVHGITFLFSSHDTKVIDRARRVVHLTDGQVTSAGMAA
jgi:putative ABC transport system ATP-binding protein